MTASALAHLTSRIVATLGRAATPWRACAACALPVDAGGLCAACRRASGMPPHWRLRTIGSVGALLPVYALGLYRDAGERSATPCASLLRRFKYAADRAAGRALMRTLVAAPRLPLAP